MSPHLQRLEDEAIFIIREVLAEFSRPVMLYSVGKDSSVMLHLAPKAFFPASPPFPFLHIASGWDFSALLAHRDRMAAEYGLELLIQSNEMATANGVNPFDTETGEYTRLMLTEALKASLDHHGFDAALSGGRRDEEKSHVEERIFSLRAPGHAWEPAGSPPSCGAGSMLGWSPAKRCGSFRCPIGPSSTSGPTSPPNCSRSCRSISRPSGRSWSATAPS